LPERAAALKYICCKVLTSIRALLYYYIMKKSTISTRIGVFAGAVAFCAGTAFAQQPAQGGAFQPAQAPLQLQQPVQAQPGAFQPAPAPIPQQTPVQAQPVPPPPYQGQVSPPGAPPAVAAPVTGQFSIAGKVTMPKSGVIDAASSMRLGVELSAEALAAAPYLYYNKGRNPGVGRVAFPKERDIYQRFDKVTVEPIKKELPFKTGDTVDVLKSIKKIKVGGEKARLVARTARGIVLGFAGKNAVIRLTDMWGKVEGSERVVKYTPFIPVYFDDKPASGADVKAKVVLHVDGSVTPYMHQYIVLNKGSEAGVKLGDFFKVMDRKRPDRIPEELVEAQVLNVTAKASTLVLQKVYRERLRLGDEAGLSFRAADK